MELGWRAGFAAPAASAGWEWQGQWLLCCKPGLLIPVIVCTRHWTSLPRAQAFQGSHLGKISKLTMPILPLYSAALHKCLLCLQQTLTASWKILRSGVLLRVWHLQCLGGVSWMGGGKCSKHWERQYFCSLPFQVDKKLCCSQLPLPVILGLVSTYGIGINVFQQPKR